MTREEILEKLRKIIKNAVSEKANSVDSYDESTNLNTDLGLTSIGLLYIVIAVEESFGIRFDDVGFSDFVTVSDVVDYIYNKKN